MMRAGWWGLAALVFVAAFSPLDVRAQTVGSGQKTQMTGTKIAVIQVSDTTGMPVLEGSVNGSLLVNEASPVSSMVLSGGSDAINGTYVPGNAALTAAISTQGLTGLAIELLVSPANLVDSAGVYYFGVRVMRASTQATDSLTAMTERRWPAVPNGATADSCGTLSGFGTIAISTLPASSLNGLPTTAMPGEIIVPVIVGDIRSRNTFINLTDRVPNGSPYVAISVRPISAVMGAALTTSVTTVATTFRVNVRGWR